MRIHLAAHILPERYFARLQQMPGFYMSRRIKGIPTLWDLGAHLRIMDRFDEYKQVLLGPRKPRATMSGKSSDGPMRRRWR